MKEYCFVCRKETAHRPLTAHVDKCEVCGLRRPRSCDFMCMEEVQPCI